MPLRVDQNELTGYHSFAGEVEASNTPTIRGLTPSRRHQLRAIAPHGTDMCSSQIGNSISAALPGAWRTALLYLSAILVGNLAWEIFQLPLYTISHTGDIWEQAFAVIHCTVGDLLIAALTFGLALLTMGYPGWPALHFTRVAAGTTALGLSYTVFSEWLNASVLHDWAYSDLMPVISLASLEIGLSPVLQWSLIPLICFVYARWRR